MKRAFDVMAALLALMLLLPIMLLAAVAIVLDSQGPVFFRQRRVGRDRTLFEIIKFRTMVSRKEPDQHAESVIEGGGDARITRVGRILRSTSIDELPQLVNILRGEMSLVGPRPVLPEQLEVVPEGRMVRFSVRPGITGLAQINGRRGLDWMDQLAFDARYAEEQSFFGDLLIILRTVFVVFGGGGVYADKSKNWRAYREEQSNSDD